MQSLGLGARLWLALMLPWRVLFDGLFAARVRAVARGQGALPEGATPQPAAPEPEKPAPVVTAAEPDTTAALQLLGILQREGRFVDFLEEDMTSFSDAEIGAAARVVHEGCARGLREYIQLAPVRTEPEGQTIELPPGFDAARTRITGNVVGEPPYRGVLAHPGWEVKSIQLPKLNPGHDCHVVAPAEVEL